jgi:hypothetical protein
VYLCLECTNSPYIAYYGELLPFIWAVYLLVPFPTDRPP